MSGNQYKKMTFILSFKVSNVSIGKRDNLVIITGSDSCNSLIKAADLGYIPVPIMSEKTSGQRLMQCFRTVSTDTSLLLNLRVVDVK